MTSLGPPAAGNLRKFWVTNDVTRSLQPGQVRPE